MIRPGAALATLLLICLALVGGPGARSDVPTLWTPAAPDSAPPESDPAPLIVPGLPGAADSTADRAARAREYFRRGLELERQRHPGPAVVSYQAALRFDPTLREANYRMGLLFNTRGQWIAAAQAFAAEVSTHPDHREAARELGIALARTGDHALALKQLEGLSRRTPRDGRVWHALGFTYFQAGRPREAEQALRRAIALPPADREEHRDLGVVLAAAGRDREAREHYQRALQLAPGDPATWLNLGNLERRAGRADSALACYRRAVAGDSSFSLAYEAQTATLREQGRDAEALEVYRLWLERDGANNPVRQQAVELLIRHGRHDEAVAWAEAGVRASPRGAPPLVLHGVALASRGRVREALHRMRQGQQAYGGAKSEVERVEGLIAALRAEAPDSLRALFAADSLRVATARARRDSIRASAPSSPKSPP